DAETGQPVAGPLRHDDPVLAVYCPKPSRSLPSGPDSRRVRVLTVTATETHWWDGTTGKPLRAPVQHGVRQPTFPPDFTSGTGVDADGAVWIWNAVEQLGKPDPTPERFLKP